MECDITTLPEQIKLKASVHQQYEYSKRRWDAGYFGFTQKKRGGKKFNNENHFAPVKYSQ